MATEMITLKLDGTFLKQIDALVKTSNYQNRTEFIRNTLREKVDQVKLQQAMLDISKLRGAGKKAVQTSDEELRFIRAKVAEEFDKKFK